MSAPSVCTRVWAGICLLVPVFLAPCSRAEDYSHGGGDYDDAHWTRGNVGDPDYTQESGPPGSGDNASLGGGPSTTLTASGGSVDKLFVGLNFNVSGSFSARTYIGGDGFLSGGGKVTATTIGADDFNVTDIHGGHLVGTNIFGTADLEGGTLDLQTCKATIMVIDAGAKVTIATAVTDLNATVSGGGSLTVPRIDNGLDESLTIKDADSTVTIADDFTVSAGFLDIAGGTLKVQSDLVLDGGKDTEGTDVGGGGHWTGADTFVSVAGTFYIGNKSGGGFSLGIDSGAVVSANEAQIGSAAGSAGNAGLSGADTIWSLSKSLVVGSAGTGKLSIDTGAQLQLGSGTLFAVGLSSGGNGSLNADGSATVVDARNALVSIGKDAGAKGQVFLSGGASVLLGKNTYVGDGGSGVLIISDGSKVRIDHSSTTDINFGLGNEKGSNGNMSVSGSGSQFAAGKFVLMIVGAQGNGSLGIGSGADAQTYTLGVAATPGVTGTVVLVGAGSTWTNFDNTFVGTVKPGVKGGTGSISLSDGASMRAASNAKSKCYISPTGRIVLDAASRFAVGSGSYGPAGSLVISGGVLSGQGRQQGSTVVGTNVTGNVIVGAGGRFQPGGDPNVFVIEGDCDLSGAGAGGGAMDIEVAGAGTAGTDYGQVVVSGKTTLGGTLNLVLLPGYKPKVGDKLAILKSGSVSGRFTKVNSPGLTVNPVASGGSLSVTVTSVASASAPAITSDGTAAAFVGAPFTYQITGSNTPAGFTATGLPDGLDIDAVTGLIAGTPRVAGTFSVKLTATNVAGTGTETLALTVHASLPGGAPMILSETSATGEVGTAFSYQIEASNSPTKYTATGLPAGLTLATGTGLISGTPAAAGTFTVALTAANASGTGKATLTLKVTAVSTGTPTVTVAATGSGVSAEGAGKIKVAFRRTGSTSAPLTVRYKIKGSAKSGVDYKPLPGTVTIPAGAAQAKIRVRPINNTTVDGTRTAKVKILQSTEGAYQVGTPGTAKLRILDND